MLKKIIYSIFFVMLLFLNMALFTWYVNHMNLGDSLQASFDQTLVANAQAAINPHPDTTPHNPVMHAAVTTNNISSKKSIAHSLNTRPASHDELEESNYRIILRVKSLHTHLDDADRIRLEEALTRLAVNHDYNVKILSGTEPVENNALSPQSLKLRSQAVARIIYPYTQNIKMQYRPSLKMSTMIVEFSPKTVVQ